MMENAWYIYALAIFAGIVAGIINTLAGSGSVVTLPMLVLLGLPANVANATNRVGVAIQNVVGIATFQRSGKMNLAGGLWLVLPSLPGAVVGAWIASILDKDQMNLALGIVMVIMLFVVLFNPQKWLRDHSEVKEGRPAWWALLLFFFIGVYGGFIQAGVGVFLLAAMVLGLGYSLVHANAIKLMIVLSVTLVALAVFLITPDLIDWPLGLLMVVGQSIGAGAAIHDDGQKRSRLGAPPADRGDRLFDLQVLRPHRSPNRLDRRAVLGDIRTRTSPQSLRTTTNGWTEQVALSSRFHSAKHSLCHVGWFARLRRRRCTSARTTQTIRASGIRNTSMMGTMNTSTQMARSPRNCNADTNARDASRSAATGRHFSSTTRTGSRARRQRDFNRRERDLVVHHVLASLQLLNLPTHLGEAAMHRQDVFRRGIGPGAHLRHQFAQFVLGGFQVAQLGLDVAVLVGHILPVNRRARVQRHLL